MCKCQKHRQPCKKNCKSCKVLIKRDFRDKNTCKLSQTFVISREGKYCLGENIGFEPDVDNSVAILIKASNVILDLCGNKLYQKNDPSLPGQLGAVGIAFEENVSHSNITIKNGTLSGFGGASIKASMLRDGVEPDDQQTLDTISFLNLKILDNGNGTVDTNPVQGVPIFEVGAPPTPTYSTGISLITDALTAVKFQNQYVYQNIIVSECQMIKNTGSSMFVSYGKNITIKDSQLNDAYWSLAPFGSQTSNMCLVTGENISIESSSFNNAVITTSDAGFVFGSFGVLFNMLLNVQGIDSKFNNSRIEESVVGVSVFAGGIVGGSMSNSHWTNCQFNNSTGTSSTILTNAFHISDVTDVEVSNSGNKFVNCQFNDTSRIGQGVIPGDTTGLWINNSRGTTLTDCQFENISSEFPLVRAVGIRFISGKQDPVTDSIGAHKSNTAKNCTFTNIVGAGNAVGVDIVNRNEGQDGVAGEFMNTVIEDSVITRIVGQDSAAGIHVNLLLPTQGESYAFVRNVCIKGNCISEIKGANDDATAGILINSTERPIVCDNIINDATNGILMTGSDLINPPFWFQLAADQATALAISSGQQFTGYVDITGVAPAPGPQTFTPSAHPVDVVTVNGADPAQVKAPENGIDTGAQDLNTLNWVAGEAIDYSNGGGSDIPGLVDGTTYYAIVYVPGFTRNGVIQENKVENCTVSGYRDENSTSANLWINNTAFNNGPSPAHDENYSITFPGIFSDKIDTGSLTNFPVSEGKYRNVSIIP